MSTETTFVAAALDYAQGFGLAVFPCAPRRKEPLTPHGHLDATIDVDTIERWGRQHPDANVAIACSASRIVTLDVDLRGGDHEVIAGFLAEQAAVSTGTWAVETSRDGRHVYLGWSPTAAEQPRFVRALLPGIEIKSNGYVLAPPSVHPLGHVYRWVRGQSPHDLVRELGYRPAVCPPALWHRMVKPACPALATAPGLVTDSLLAELCQRRGIVRGAIGDDRLAITCPWSAEHSMDGGTGEAVLFAPRVPGGLGGFYCAHLHCGSRGSRELLACFTPEEIDTARAALTARGVAAPRRRSVLIEVAC
jgi:hypothetical protein